MLRTKVVCTLGPATSSFEMIRALVERGMDVARVNMSHGDRAGQAGLIDAVRAAAAEARRPVAVLVDLAGPKIRVGELPSELELEPGRTVIMAPQESALPGEIPTTYAPLAEEIRPGDSVLLDDGLLELRCIGVDGERVRLEVLRGGSLRSRRGINLPTVEVRAPSLTEKDLEDLDFALGKGVEYVGLSFVRRPEDVIDLKERVAGRALVVAKIEKVQALWALEEITAEADAVMVARGDLGVEIGAADVPLLQKRIIARALERGKPVITATQMLESMVQAPEPTRAEASDVANAILDGTSAVMLSGETAIGDYPVEAVRVMVRIAHAVEPSLDYRHETPRASDDPTIGQAMSNAACDIAEALSAKALLVPTFTGRTASAVARLRPRRPIIALTHKVESLRHLALEWGVVPLPIPETDDVEDLWSRSVGAAREAGLVDPGQRVVITAGTAVNIPGSTNVIKVDVA